MKATPTSFMFIVIMSLLGAMSAFATDMSLAAVEPMARDLHVRPGTVGLSLSAFMISFALAPLVYGPLSDRFGRRPLALLACLVYVIGGIGCVFAPSLPSLLVWRFVQGIGGGARPARPCHYRRSLQGICGTRKDVLRRRAQPARTNSRAVDRLPPDGPRQLASDLCLSHAHGRACPCRHSLAPRGIAPAGAAYEDVRAGPCRELCRGVPKRPLAAVRDRRRRHVRRHLRLRVGLALRHDRRLPSELDRVRPDLYAELGRSPRR